MRSEEHSNNQGTVIFFKNLNLLKCFQTKFPLKFPELHRMLKHHLKMKKKLTPDNFFVYLCV